MNNVFLKKNIPNVRPDSYFVGWDKAVKNYELLMEEEGKKIKKNKSQNQK